MRRGAIGTFHNDYSHFFAPSAVNGGGARREETRVIIIKSRRGETEV